MYSSVLTPNTRMLKEMTVVLIGIQKFVLSLLRKENVVYRLFELFFISVYLVHKFMLSCVELSRICSLHYFSLSVVIFKDIENIKF